MNSSIYATKVTDVGTLINMVAIRAPDRWMVYTLAPHNDIGYAKGVAYSYPHRGPALLDDNADHFTFEYLRVNAGADEMNATTHMAILAVLRDTQGPVPDTIDIRAKRLLIVDARDRAKKARLSVF